MGGGHPKIWGGELRTPNLGGGMGWEGLNYFGDQNLGGGIWGETTNPKRAPKFGGSVTKFGVGKKILNWGDAPF